MKTKILLIGCAIIAIAVLFAVPAMRDGQEADRYDGRPFPDRNGLGSSEVLTIGEPRSAEVDDLTVSEVAPSVSSNFQSVLSIQPAAENPTNTLTLEEPEFVDPMFSLEDESSAVSTNELFVDATSESVELPTHGEQLSELVSDVEQLSELVTDVEPLLPEENPFDRPVQMPSSPFDRPIQLTVPIEAPVAMVENESPKLPIIDSGTGFSPFGVGQSHVEVNPYVSDNITRIASRAHIRRPVAMPSYDQTPTNAVGTGEFGTDEMGSTRPTSVMIPSQSKSTPLTESSPSDENQIFDQPVPVGAANSPDSILEPVPTDVPIESPITPIFESPPVEEPAYTNNAPVVPSYSTPNQSSLAPTHNNANIASWNRRNPGVDTFSGSTYLQNSWTSSIFQPDGCGGYGCEPSFPNEGRWGDTSSTLSFGGWFSAGYHEADNQLFNNRPDKFALHQGWMYLEKSATSDSPLGFRVDAIYGIDGTDTQAFGNEPGNWDYLNGLDFGAYSWAIPQAYLEVAIGETYVRVGHFFTLIGYETVPARDNFFYSHAMTMYNSEPFTHTGVMVNRSFGDFDVYGGWTLGWDTGFDRFGDGGSWLGGFTYNMSNDASFSYFSSAGDFGARGDEGYSQSVVLNLSLSENLNYVLQSDYLRVASTGEDNVGIAQFTTYKLTDKLSLGSRLEWWKGDVLTGYAPHGGTLPAAGSLSYFATTFGANIRPTDSLVIRPEIRHDWSPSADYDETYFGIDAVWSF